MADMFNENRLEEFRESFALFEKDDSHIACKDLGNVMRSLGQHPTEKDLNDLTGTFDPESTGLIEFNDFLHIMARTIKDTDPETELMEALKMLDKDNSGQIANAQLRKILTTYGEVLDDEEMDELIKETDVDADGIIDFAEFVSVVTAE